MANEVSACRFESPRRSVYSALLAVALLMFCATPPAFAQEKFQVFGVNLAAGTFVNAINLGGTVAGSWFDAGRLEHGYLRAPKGTITTFDPPASVYGTTVFGLNNSGAVVGYYLNSGFVTTGFLRSPSGSYTDIFYPGSFATQASSINDAGVIAGSYNFGTGFVVSPPYGAGDYKSFSIPGGSDISPAGINSAGRVAGIYLDTSSHELGFVWDSATNTFTFYNPPAPFTNLQITSINDNGEVTGQVNDGTHFYGFEGQGGAVTATFKAVTSFSTSGESINLSGEIVGEDCGNGFTPCFGFIRRPFGGALWPVDVPAKDESVTTLPTTLNDLGIIAGNWINRSDFRLAFVVTLTQVGTLGSGATCNGTYDKNFNGGDVTVSAGQVCNFTGGSINGNVTVNGGTLGLSHAKVNGNVRISGGNFAIGPSTTIAGNLQINNLPAPSSQNQICGATVQGNLQFQSNDTAVEIGGPAGTGCAGNTIGGNLQVNNNNAPITVVGNTVSGGLACVGNFAITGSGNKVGGHKQGQCAGF